MDKQKSAVLGMPISTANSKLRKDLLFKYVQMAGHDNCYRCGQRIESIDEFSIEHIEAWLHSDNPKKLFFSLDNILFSHRICNSSGSKNFGPAGHPRKGNPSPFRRVIKDGQTWCFRGKHYVDIEKFHKDKNSFLGLKGECSDCRNGWRRNRYQNNLSR